MKKIKFIISILTLVITCFSCKKEANIVKPVPISAITVVNALVGANPVVADFSGVKPISTYYSTTPQIGYGAFQEFSEVSGNLPLTIYQLTDTVRALYQKTISLQGAGIYSLFLTGDTTNADFVLTKDNLPYHSPTDSTSGIRFINLSVGSSPVSVNVQGSAYGSSVSSLAYKASTDFKNYPTSSAVTQYIFEIRDAASGTLLTTYTYNTAPFQNITIAVIGQPGSSASVPISAMKENNF